MNILIRMLTADVFEKSCLAFSAEERLLYQGRRGRDTVIKNADFSGSSLWFLWKVMGAAQPRIHGVKIWLTRQDSDQRVLVAAAANLHKSGCPLEILIIFNLFSQQKWLKVNSLCLGFMVSYREDSVTMASAPGFHLLLFISDGCGCGSTWVEVLIYIEGYLLGLLNWIYEVG